MTQCIPLLWVCDTDPDCHGGSDESKDMCQNVGSCGGDFTTPNGILYSKSYPDNYPENTDCIYTISQPKGTVIRLNFLSMDVEAHPTCNYDYLEIRDGPTAASTVLDKRCGKKTGPIQSTQNKLWMK